MQFVVLTVPEPCWNLWINEQPLQWLTPCICSGQKKHSLPSLPGTAMAPGLLRRTDKRKNKNRNKQQTECNYSFKCQRTRLKETPHHLFIFYQPDQHQTNRSHPDTANGNPSAQAPNEAPMPTSALTAASLHHNKTVYLKSRIDTHTQNIIIFLFTPCHNTGSSASVCSRVLSLKPVFAVFLAQVWSITLLASSL